MSSETDKERVNRELIELLNELRVALPGVQVLFAFLLSVPFTQRFGAASSFQHAVYFVALLCSAAASLFLIAPSAQHRVLFRADHKEQMIKSANRLALIGLGFLAASITAVLVLVADYLYGATATVVVGLAAVVGFATLWAAIPLRVRRRE